LRYPARWQKSGLVQPATAFGSSTLMGEHSYICGITALFLSVTTAIARSSAVDNDESTLRIGKLLLLLKLPIQASGWTNSFAPGDLRERPRSAQHGYGR